MLLHLNTKLIQHTRTAFRRGSTRLIGSSTGLLLLLKSGLGALRSLLTAARQLILLHIRIRGLSSTQYSLSFFLLIRYLMQVVLLQQATHGLKMYSEASLLTVSSLLIFRWLQAHSRFRTEFSETAMFLHRLLLL